MNRPALSEPAQTSAGSLIAACAILAALLAVAGLGFGYYGYQQSGMDGVQAAVVAGVICWFAGALALTISFAGKLTGLGVQSVLAATLVRLGMPLAAGLLLKEQSPTLAEAGVFGMILGNYLLMLVAETLLSLLFVAPSSKPMTKAA